MSRAPSGNEFALGVVSLDDGPFIERLRDDRGRFISTIQAMQAAADKASAQMRSDIGQVPPAIKQMNAAAINASNSLAGLGNAATLLGGQIGGVVGELTHALQLLRNMAQGAGALGVIFSALTVAIYAVTKAWQASSRALEEAEARQNKLREEEEKALEIERKREATFRTEQLQIQAKGGSEVAARELERDRRRGAGLGDFEIRILEEQERQQRLRHAVNRQEKELVEFRAQQLKEFAAEEERIARIREQVEKEISAERRTQLDARIEEAQALDRQIQSRARGLAVAAGIRRPSDFELDPRLREIAQLEEQLQRSAQTPRLAFGAAALGGLTGIGGATKLGTGEDREKRKVELIERIETLLSRIEANGGAA